jgi:hypothetical protein
MEITEGHLAIAVTALQTILDEGIEELHEDLKKALVSGITSEEERSGLTRGLFHFAITLDAHDAILRAITRPEPLNILFQDAASLRESFEEYKEAAGLLGIECYEIHTKEPNDS